MNIMDSGKDRESEKVVLNFIEINEGGQKIKQNK